MSRPALGVNGMRLFVGVCVTLVLIPLLMGSVATAQYDSRPDVEGSHNIGATGECTENPDTEPYTGIQDVFPARLRSPIPGINPIEINGTMVVRGTTTRDPDDFEVKVGAIDGPSADQLGTVTTDEVARNGTWTVELEVNSSIEPGTYTIQAVDGDRVDRVDVEIALHTNFDIVEKSFPLMELEDEIEYLEGQIENLKENKTKLKDEIEELEKTLEENGTEEASETFHTPKPNPGDFQASHEASRLVLLSSTGPFAEDIPYTEIQEAVPKHLEDFDYVRPNVIEVGETMVVRGTTNRKLGESRLEVRAVEGCQATELGTTTVSRWNWTGDGSWKAELAVPDEIEPGAYTIQVSDGERIDRLELDIVAKGTVPSRKLRNETKYRNRIRGLEEEVKSLREERDECARRLEELRSRRDELRQRVENNTVEEDADAEDDGVDDEATEENGEEGLPGFTPVATLVALLATLYAARTS